MTPAQAARADAYFQAQCGLSFQQLIAPIDASAPAGHSLRHTPVYAAIAQARQHDDASLPMGGWESDLKRADWPRVASLAAQALAHNSKDLQLAAWLLQAQLERTGFDALAPGLELMRQLCTHYWDTLHPVLPDGDVEQRANIFRWMNEKLLPSIRLLSLTQGGRTGDFSWADWEQARHKQALKAAAGAQEGPDTAQFLAVLRGTPAPFHHALQDSIDAALARLQALDASLAQCFGTEAHSLQTLTALLHGIQALLAAELRARSAA